MTVNRIKLSWLVRLRWAAVAGQTVAIAIGRWSLDIDLPVAPLAVLIAFPVLATWLPQRM